MVRTLRYPYLKLVHACLCVKFPAECADMRWTYVIHHANDVDSGASETKMSRRFWIRMMIHSNSTLGAKNGSMDFMYNC